MHAPRRLLVVFLGYAVAALVALAQGGAAGCSAAPAAGFAPAPSALVSPS